MRCRRYYTLVASLPPLPHFERARRLPITRERLVGRLGLLEPGDRALVERLAAFLRWHRRAHRRDDAAIVAEYRELAGPIAGSACAQLVEDAVTRLTLLVALRRRQQGRPAPAPDEPWGLGPWTETVRSRWEQPEFGLGAVFPWLARARELLAAGQALELERLLTAQAWEQLDRARPADPFRFEALLVYLFRWSLLEQWLSYSAAAARPRFDQLVTEAIGAYRELLH